MKKLRGSPRDRGKSPCGPAPAKLSATLMQMTYQNPDGASVASIYETGYDSTARREFMRTHGMLPAGAAALGAGGGAVGIAAALKGPPGSKLRRFGIGGAALGGLVALGGLAGAAKVLRDAPPVDDYVRLLSTDSPDDDMVLDVLRLQNNDLSPNRFELRHGFVPAGVASAPYDQTALRPLGGGDMGEGGSAKTSAYRVGQALALNSPWAVK